MSFLSRTGAILWKELRSEFRTKETVSTMLVFALLVIVVFSFAFDPTASESRALFPGIIWVAFFFAGTLGLNRSFVVERLNDSLHGLMLAPVDRSAIYFGKLLANMVFMVTVELVSLPVFTVLFSYSPGAGWGRLIVVTVLATFGFMAVGTFLAALAANTRTSEMLLPVILFPVVIPLVISAIEATRGIFEAVALSDIMTWFKVLSVYDVVFVVVPFLLFEYLLEV